MLGHTGLVYRPPVCDPSAPGSGSLLLHPAAALTAYYDTPLAALPALQKSIAAAHAPLAGVRSVAALGAELDTVPFGQPLLDAALGGLRAGAVVELAGPPGSGRAALAAAWLRRARRPALWLHSGSARHTAAVAQRAGPLVSFLQTPVLTDAVACVEQLLAAAPAALRLLVVSDFSVMVRRDCGRLAPDDFARQGALAAAVQLLKALAGEQRLTVLLITECAAVRQRQAVSPEAAGELGRVFYHAVNARLRLSPCQDGSGLSRLAVVKSAQCPGHAILMRESASGLEEVGAVPLSDGTGGWGEEVNEMIDGHDSVVTLAFLACF